VILGFGDLVMLCFGMDEGFLSDNDDKPIALLYIVATGLGLDQ
jgi:hypothetical protein